MASRLLLTLAADAGDAAAARTLVESLRAFGGPYADSPVWVFGRPEAGVPDAITHGRDTRFLPLALDEPLRSYPFAYKVFAAATAADLLSAATRTVVWLDSEALILRPPGLFDTDAGCRAALRPVHIRNVGLRVDQPLDVYWTGVYGAVGLPDPLPRSVRSLVEDQPVRPYFNCGAYSVDPALGVFRLWWEYFQELVRDARFQDEACADEDHRIFLHQAVLSALLTKHVAWQEIRILPPDYGYPLHFHRELARTGRELAVDELTCPLSYHVAASDRASMWRQASEPLRGWLLERAGG